MRILVVIMILLDAIWWSWAHVRLRNLKRVGLWRVLLAVFMLVQMIGLGSRLLRPMHSRALNDFLPFPVVAGQYLWHLLILPLAVLVPLLTTLGRLGRSGYRALIADSEPPKNQNSDGPSRRQVLASLSVAVPPLLLAASVGAAYEQDGRFRVRNVTLRIGELPPELDGLTIAHITDLHVGRFMQPSMLPAVVSAVNNLHCDIIAFTGDLIDYALGDLNDGLEALKRMRPQENLVMCVGNHDLFQSRDKFIDRVREAGMRLLIDQSQELRVRGHAVQMLGIDWAHGDDALGEFVGKVNAMRRPGAFPILLAHHPHAFDAAAAAGFPLTLAGHTHGGQLMLTDQIGAGSLIFRYTSGIYWKDNCALFVSNGIGNWLPLRINAPAEIVKITLRCAKARGA